MGVEGGHKDGPGVMVWILPPPHHQGSSAMPQAKAGSGVEVWEV